MESNKRATLFIGFGIILFSFFLLIRLLTKLDATTQIVDYWPIFIFFVGLLSINPKNTGAIGISLGLMGLGTFGVLYRIGIFQTPGGQAFLAIMLGLVGLTILVLAVSKPHKPKRQSNTPSNLNATHQQPLNKSNRG